MRTLLGLMTVAFLTASVAAADNPPADRAATIKRIKADANKASTVLEEQLQEAKSDRETKTLELAYTTKVKALLDDAVKVFTEVPTDEPAAVAAFFVFGYGTADQITAAGNQILKNNIADKRVKGAIAASSEYGELALPFLKDVAKKSTDTENQAFAYFVIGRIYAEQSEESGEKPELAQKTGKIAEGYFALAAETNGTMKLGAKTTMAMAVKEDLYLLQNLAVGKLAPDIEGVGFDGTKTKLSSYRGKVVVLDFWKTTCGPCLAMIPTNREIVKAMADKPFAFIGVNLDENKAIGKRFVEDNNLTWPQWWSEDDAGAADVYRIRKYPSIFVIDAKGVIRYKHPHPRLLLSKVEVLVKEAEAKK